MTKDNYQFHQQFLINRIEWFINLVSTATGNYSLGITRSELELFRLLVLKYQKIVPDYDDKFTTYKLNEIYYEMGSIVAPIVGQMPRVESRSINYKKM